MLMQVGTSTNYEVQLSFKRAKINKKKKPYHMRNFNMCTNRQQSENFLDPNCRWGYV